LRCCFSESYQVSDDQLLPEELARFFFVQFIDALAYMHARNVAHRDLKLSNTLLSGDEPPRIKMCDFGLSRDFGGGGSAQENELMNAYTTVGSEC
jgi:serine/threonine protein kinase